MSALSAGRRSMDDFLYYCIPVQYSTEYYCIYSCIPVNETRFYSYRKPFQLLQSAKEISGLTITHVCMCVVCSVYMYL